MASFGRVPSWRFLVLCFTFDAALFVATRTVTSLRGRELHAATEQAMRDTLTSAELIARMGRDLASERQLIDTHIAAREASTMARLDERLGQLDLDFVAASSEYAPLADQAEERRVWRALESDVALTRPLMTAVLARSRADRDADARAMLPVLDERFTAVDDEIRQLASLNRVEVTRALADLDRRQSSLNLTLGGLALAGIALTALGGIAAIALVHRRERELLRYSTMLETQNRELDAFAGRVAHDLRNPLTTLRLVIQRLTLLADRGVDTGSAVRSIERMDALIRDLLSLSRIESESRQGSCDPAGVAGALRQELAARLEAAAATLQVEVEPARVRCGEGLLTEALANLADNALKYRRPDAPPRIHISGREAGQRYELRVADNGIGMSPDEQRQAFTSFYRARRDSAVRGTGLGLSIVKRIAEASGGDVAVESTPGEGTTFVIHLLLGNR
jgi:signal transduction histidine kinase